MRLLTCLHLAAGPAMVLAAGTAMASSGAAWEAFRAEVAAACTALAPPGEVAVEVDPFGSAHYGVAILTVTRAEGRERMICIFDKATRGAEITAPAPF